MKFTGSGKSGLNEIRMVKTANRTEQVESSKPYSNEVIQNFLYVRTIVLDNICNFKIIKQVISSC